MLATSTRAKLDRIEFPLGSQTKEETRAEAEARRPGRRAPGESQEACFLAGDDYRAFLERRGLAARRARSSTKTDASSGGTRATGASRPVSARACGSPQPSRSTRSARTPRPTPSWSARVQASRGRRSMPRRLYVPVERVEAKLRYQSEAIPAGVERTADGFSLTLDRAAYGVAPGQAAVLYEQGAVVGAGLIQPCP